MFGLFQKSPTGIKVIDKVWLTRQAKLKACASMVDLDPDVLFITWFRESYDELRHFLNASASSEVVLLADDVQPDQTRHKMVVFAEHYPLATVEQDFFEKLSLKEAPVLTSVDEPFFHQFGGERLSDLMKKMGVKEHEVLGHSMITKSIRRAQEAIAKKASGDRKASSQEEWFALNIPKQV